MKAIEGLLEGRTWPEPEFSVIKRCIHVTGDPGYADILKFSEGAANAAISLIILGTDVICDAKSTSSLVNRNRLREAGGEVLCFTSVPEVIDRAKTMHISRSVAALEYEFSSQKPAITVVGTSTSALIHLCDLMDAGKANPAFVVATTAGFADVAESKERLMTYDVPYILTKGTRGGSAVAAAICNALIYSILDRQQT